MTRLLTGVGAFKTSPMTLVDVGARGGYDEIWDVFGDQLKVIGFEPDEKECANLNATAAHNVTYLPYALGAQTEERQFFIAQFSGSSSLYSGDTVFIRRFFEGDNLRTVGKTSVQVRRLDEVFREQNITHVDFLKLDCEGADLDILKGSEAILDDATMLGVLVEVWFQRGARDGAHSFPEVDQYLNSKGFLLYDLSAYRYNRTAMPYPFVVDVRDEKGGYVNGQTTHGQIIRGDALYLRDYVGMPASSGAGSDIVQTVKLACLFEVFGLNDCAAELLSHERNQLTNNLDVELLLDLLTPELRGKQLKYREYLSCTTANPALLRPSLSSFQDLMKRFAAVVLRFDGKVLPILKFAWGKLVGVESSRSEK